MAEEVTSDPRVKGMIDGTLTEEEAPELFQVTRDMFELIKRAQASGHAVPFDTEPHDLVSVSGQEDDFRYDIYFPRVTADGPLDGMSWEEFLFEMVYAVVAYQYLDPRAAERVIRKALRKSRKLVEFPLI